MLLHTLWVGQHVTEGAAEGPYWVVGFVHNGQQFDHHHPLSYFIF